MLLEQLQMALRTIICLPLRNYHHTLRLQAIRALLLHIHTVLNNCHPTNRHPLCTILGINFLLLTSGLHVIHPLLILRNTICRCMKLYHPLGTRQTIYTFYVRSSTHGIMEIMDRSGALMNIFPSPLIIKCTKQ